MANMVDRIRRENPHLAAAGWMWVNSKGGRRLIAFFHPFPPNDRIAEPVECFCPITGEHVTDGFA